MPGRACDRQQAGERDGLRRDDRSEPRTGGYSGIDIRPLLMAYLIRSVRL